MAKKRKGKSAGDEVGDIDDQEALESEVDESDEIEDAVDEEDDLAVDDVEEAIEDAIEDEIEGAIEGEVEVEAAADAETDAEEEEEAAVEAPRARTVAARGGSKRVDGEALHTVAAREDVRRKLAADVEAFLKRGGAIQDVPQDARAEPPKKPEGSYGRGSV
jgi:hypothetical protein